MRQILSNESTPIYLFPKEVTVSLGRVISALGVLFSCFQRTDEIDMISACWRTSTLVFLSCQWMPRIFLRQFFRFLSSPRLISCNYQYDFQSFSEKRLMGLIWALPPPPSSPCVVISQNSSHVNTHSSLQKQRNYIRCNMWAIRFGIYQN